MVLAIRGVSSNNNISLSNYSLTTQIIIINLFTSIIGLIFLFLFNYILLLNNESLDNQIANIKNDLYQVGDYLSEKSVIRIPQFKVESCLRSKDHQIVIAPKCLENNRQTYEFSETSDLQLDPTSTQKYILDNYLNKTNSIKVYDDTWIKFADTEDIYVSSDIIEVDIGTDIEEYSNNLNLYIQYKNHYLRYFNYFQEYFNRTKIQKGISKYSDNSRITKYKGDILLVKETIIKQSNLSYVFEDDSNNIIIVHSSPIKKDDSIYGVVLVSGILNKENNEVGLISFNLINLFIIIICIMFFLSILFSQSIVSPIKTLSKIVRIERDKSKKNKNKLFYPQRLDEIGILSNDIHSMSKDLKNRINEIEDFTADVSHELKNPLASLKSSNELLINNKITAEKKSLILKNMQKDIERMNTLITDISRYTLTGIELESELFYRFDIVDFLEEFLKSYPSHSKDIKIKFEFENKPSMIYASKDKLAQVFINLIDNSFSYSPRNSEILIHQKNLNKDVIILISDQGQGMTQDLKNKIFERFYTDRTSNKDQHTGLGLSIAKKIIENFSGSIKLINVNSQKYLGACFEINLPLKD